MSIFGWPYPALISILIGATNMIPFFGPFIGAIPATFLILLVNPWQAVFFVIFIVVLQQVDGNIIAPRILGSSTGLPAIMVITAITIMGGIFGMVGMVIAVPVFAVLAKLIYEKTEKRISKQANAAKDTANEDGEPLVSEAAETSDVSESPKSDDESEGESL